jgi:hypothetical protein
MLLLSNSVFFSFITSFPLLLHLTISLSTCTLNGMGYVVLVVPIYLLLDFQVGPLWKSPYILFQVDLFYRLLLLQTLDCLTLYPKEWK